VTHWSKDPDDPRWTDPYWNDPSFGGASRSLADLRTAPDPSAAALGFFRAGASITGIPIREDRGTG
jgi:hypothetical protein